MDHDSLSSQRLKPNCVSMTPETLFVKSIGCPSSNLKRLPARHSCNRHHDYTQAIDSYYHSTCECLHPNINSRFSKQFLTTKHS